MLITIPGPEAVLLERTVSSIAASGPTLSGVERCEVALRSRAYAAGRATPTPRAPREALVWKLTNEACTEPRWSSSPDELPIARAALRQLAGDTGVVRAAACAGNFEMMNRLLDPTGVRVTSASLRLANELGIDVPGHLHPG